MNYIVTKPVKNKGIAALLVMLFGGIGLFYSSISGGIIMGILAPVLIYLFFFLGAISGQISIIAIVIIFCCFYYLICLIWALIAVGNYNKKIIAQSNYYNSLYQGNSPDPYILNQYDKKEKSDLWIWILVLLVLCSILYLLYKKGMIFNNTTIKSEQEVSKFEPHKDQQLKKQLGREEKNNQHDNNKIDRKILKDPNELAWKVTSFIDDPDTTNKRMISEKEERCFIFNGNKIYMFLNGYLMNTWHITKSYFEDEYEISKTTEGDTFAIFGSITIDFKSGRSIEYECDQIPIMNVHVNEEYLK